MKAKKDSLCNCCDAVELAMREACVRQNKTEEETIMLTQTVDKARGGGRCLLREVVCRPAAAEREGGHGDGAEANSTGSTSGCRSLRRTLRLWRPSASWAPPSWRRRPPPPKESDPVAKVLQNRASDDKKKMVLLTDQLTEAQRMAEDADGKYNDTS